MIAKCIMSQFNSGALIDYLFSDKKPSESEMVGRAELLHSNMVFGTPEDMKSQFAMLLDHSNLKHEVMHLVLSFPKEDREKLTDENISNILEDIEKRLGMEDFPYVAVRHYDKEESHPHIHLAIGRKSASGKTLRTSNNYRVLHKLCRDIEKKYGLKQLQTLNKEYEYSDARKMDLRFKIESALKNAKTFDAFRKNLKEVGIKVLLGRGIVYIDKQGLKCKGSDRQIGYPLSKVKSIFGELETPKQNQNNYLELRSVDSHNIPSSTDNSSSNNDLLGALVGIVNAISIPDGYVVGAGNVPHSEDEELKKRKKKYNRIKMG